MHHELILFLDFGSQYTQLIARRVREQGVYCEIHPFHLSADEIAAKRPKGVILSGGPSSVTDEDAPRVEHGFYEKIDAPILGICYGMQLAAVDLGGSSAPAPVLPRMQRSTRLIRSSRTWRRPRPARASPRRTIARSRWLRATTSNCAQCAARRSNIIRCTSARSRRAIRKPTPTAPTMRTRSRRSSPTTSTPTIAPTDPGCRAPGGTRTADCRS